MIIPNFSEVEIAKARTITLGATAFASENPRMVIATCIKPIYEKLCGALYAHPVDPQGWWLTSMTDGYLIVLTPQGSGIRDLVTITDSFYPRLLYVGLAGGLSEQLSLGSVFSVPSTQLNGAEVKAGWFISDTLPRGRIGHSNGLLQFGKTELVNLRQKGVFAVEMETWHLFSTPACIDRSAIMIISDLPLTKPFFDITPAEHDLIEAGIDEAVRIIRDNKRG